MDEQKKPLTSLDEVREERLVDKSAWERGPWDDEPDHVEWRDTRSVPVLPSMIHRNDSGALCGYVGVPLGHPWHGKDYSDVQQADGSYVDAHGGLTYVGACQVDGPLCHAPMPGESDETWWFGFDCAHYMDYSRMAMSKDFRARFPRHPNEVYRTLAYVRAEVTNLVDQARAVCK